MTVHSLNSVLMVCWMRSSVSKSTAAVASSRTRILVLRNKARARHTNCRCPTLKRHELLVVLSWKIHGIFTNPFGSNISKTPDFGKQTISIWKVIFSEYVHIVYNLPEVLPSFWTLMAQPILQSAYIVFKVGMFQSLPQLVVWILFKGVQVYSKAAREDDWVLCKSIFKSQWNILYL